MSDERVYLFVPTAEVTLAQLLGALWDGEAQCWYVEQQRLTAFSRWIPPAVGDGFNIISDAASVAAIDVPCLDCDRTTEVICIRCDGGLVDGVPRGRFTCTRIYAVDDQLSTLLEAWYPQLRQVQVPRDDQTPQDWPAFVYINHCLHCDWPHACPYLEEQWERHFSRWQGRWVRRHGIRVSPIAGTVLLGGRARMMPD